MKNCEYIETQYQCELASITGVACCCICGYSSECNVHCNHDKCGDKK